MNNKRIVFVMSLALLLLVFSLPVLAADNITMTVDAKDGQVGEYIFATVGIDNNRDAGFCAAAFGLLYDQRYLLPVAYCTNYAYGYKPLADPDLAAKIGDELARELNRPAEDIVIGSAVEAANLQNVYANGSSPQNGSAMISYTLTSSQQITGDGALVTFIFKIVDMPEDVDSDSFGDTDLQLTKLYNNPWLIADTESLYSVTPLCHNDTVKVSQAAPVQSYIVYHNNLTQDAMVQQAADFGDDVDEVLLTAQTFAKSGAYLVAWNSKADGSGSWYLPGLPASFTLAEGVTQVDLYAQWVDNVYGYIVYYSDADGQKYGGDYGGTEIFVQPGQAKQITIPADAPFTRTGYLFSDWNTRADGKGRTYLPSEKVTIAAGAGLRLHANWLDDRDPHVKLTYQYNFPDGSIATRLVSIADGIKLILPVHDNGYLFLGWYDDPTGGTRVGMAEDAYHPDQDVTLYAHWQGLRVTAAQQAPGPLRFTLTPDGAGAADLPGAELLIALYNSENRLLACRAFPQQTIAVASPAVCDFAYSGDWTEARVFVLDGMTSLLPLCSAARIAKSEVTVAP